MPSREPELYKDKIEVSLDGRQIFYLFFGGAVIVGLVFVLGVMVGRRVEEIVAGKEQILKLRADYQAQEGDAFSLKKFHDELLNHGMLPIRLLREVMLKDKAKWDEVL